MLYQDVNLVNGYLRQPNRQSFRKLKKTTVTYPYNSLRMYFMGLI